jgi:tRNA-Thr(GGU) m(6)t(6)A37 methyltransferase TsaA
LAYKEITVKPIGCVRSSRKQAIDDNWGRETFEIELSEDYTAEASEGLSMFSHVEVIFYFHLVENDRIETRARNPRNNTSWPKVGIFAQRGKNRPNRLGTTICNLVSVNGKSIKVSGLDAIDGTPVLDIKPVFSEFLPKGEVKQPDWSKEIMRDYWVLMR